MRKFILKRLCTLIPVLIVVSILVFLMVHVMPGDPARIMAGDTATEQDVEKIRVAYGFDRPLYEQYFRYISKALRGDFGTSFRTGRPVAQEIAIRFPNTMLLAVAAIVISIVFGIGIGLISATKRNSIFDSVKDGRIMPSLTLSARSLATIARMTRSSMLEVMSQDYILTAKAQGFNSRKIIFSHALKNAMNSIVTVAGIQFGTLLGGSVITEKVYGWPGLGELVITAIKARDFPVVQTTILVIAVSFVAVNLFVDVLYVLINPRIKYV